LYKQKPIADHVGYTKESKLYETTIINPEVTDDVPTVLIKFEVPFNDMGDGKFEDSIPAQLLIRYIKL
jgi:hypothetical protein